MARTRILRPQNFNPPQTCGGKYCYVSRQEAEMVIEEKAIMQPEITLTTYRCPQCHSWHLTRSIIASSEH